MMKISFSLEWFQSIWMNCLCIYSCSSCYRRRYWGHFFSIVIFFIIAISRWWMTMEKYLTSVTRLIEFFFLSFFWRHFIQQEKKYRKWLFFCSSLSLDLCHCYRWWWSNQLKDFIMDHYANEETFDFFLRNITHPQMIVCYSKSFYCYSSINLFFSIIMFQSRYFFSLSSLILSKIFWIYEKNNNFYLIRKCVSYGFFIKRTLSFVSKFSLFFNCKNYSRHKIHSKGLFNHFSDYNPFYFFILLFW